jgi:hypothetical protein
MSPFGTPRRKRGDNIKMNLKEIALWFMGWINLAWDRNQWQPLVNTIINFRGSTTGTENLYRVIYESYIISSGSQPVKKKERTAQIPVG